MANESGRKLKRLKRRLDELEEERDDERDPAERRYLARRIGKVQDQIDALEDEPTGDDDDDGTEVVVLRGKRAKSILAKMGIEDEPDPDGDEPADGDEPEPERADDEPPSDHSFFRKLG